MRTVKEKRKHNLKLPRGRRARAHRLGFRPYTLDSFRGMVIQKSSGKVAEKKKAMMIGTAVLIALVVVGILIFIAIIKVPTDNAVATVPADPEYLFEVQLEGGKYDVWIPEGSSDPWATEGSSNPTVTVETDSGREVFSGSGTSIDTNVQGYTKMGSFECDGGTYWVHSTGYGEVVISHPVSLLCNSCIVISVLLVIVGIYVLISISGWSKAKKRLQPKAPYPYPSQYPPPGQYPPQQPPPGYPPQQPPPGYPPQQPPPGYPPQQPPPDQYPPSEPATAPKAQERVTPSDEPELPDEPKDLSGEPAEEVGEVKDEPKEEGEVEENEET